MNHLPNLIIVAMLALLSMGCSSERGVKIEVVLDTDDAEISIDGVHFTAANSLMRASKNGPESDSGKMVKHNHVINSSEGNFVIVALLRNGEPLHSEIYKLDAKILSKIGNQSDWVKPDGVSSGDDKLHLRLMRQPNSFQAADEGTDFFTEIRYEVAKPYTY